MTAFNPQTATRNPFAPGSAVPTRAAPAGTFVPGTKVQVGSHRVVIEKYLSEGGFAHVYVVRLPKPVDGVELAVLKRVAVPDKDHLANMRTEVDTMKRLRGQKAIVKYIDSHASQLKGGGYEVFLLMEYCAGGGLIDFMNTRLQNRLTEPEILKIFSDVAEGVACMHYLKPPLLHRDLKVENVLISSTSSVRTYKVCDFGSAAPPRAAATSAAEGRLIEDDIQRHTTLQYRSPEMIDVYRKQPIDEKSDIWALGVLLYKLCYYTTPFEEVGQMAILNARFKYPAHPVFSDQLKLLIASMLREQPSKRPNIYQVLEKACQMQGKDVPIRDIYTNRSQSESRQNAQLPAPPGDASSRVGAMLSPPTQEKQPSIPDIAPMRRGRPTKPVSHHGSAKPSPSPLRMIDSSDPFASLDGGKAQPGDDLTARFPTLDQFSLLTDKRQTYDFDPSADEKKPAKEDFKLSERVTNALADEAFARAPSPGIAKPSKTTPPSTAAVKMVLERKRSAEKKIEVPGPHTNLSSSLPQKSPMVATVTVASPSPPPPFPPSSSDRPIYRFPLSKALQRPVSEPWEDERSRATSSLAMSSSRLAHLLDLDASQYQHAPDRTPKSPASSRPSLEGSRPSMLDLEENALTRSRSANVRIRPASVDIGSRLDHHSVRGRLHTKGAASDVETAAIESDTNIASDIDFLRAKEEEEKAWKHHKRLSSGSRHGKRSSLPSISLSGTKNLLAGRFGDAFRKFEGGNHSSRECSQSPSPSTNHVNSLTPIAGSVATDLSDDRHDFDEIEDVSPEMRRELEKRKLEAEERRVATAAAEYRKRVADRGGEGGRERPRASSIQNKVQSLLKENERPATKTAAGYGRFTDLNAASQVKNFEATPPVQVPKASAIQRGGEEGSKPKSTPPSAVASQPSYPPAQGAQRSVPKPAAPPKPQVLRTGQGSGFSGDSANDSALAGETISPNEDWETNFSKRYPSLSGLELVETEIDSRKGVNSSYEYFHPRVVDIPALKEINRSRYCMARGGRGRTGRGLTNQGGRRGSSRDTTRPHSPKSLIVTLHLRAPQHVRQLPTPESTNLSTDTPPSQREFLAQVAAGEAQGPSMAPVKDPNNVDDQIKDVIQHLFEVQSAVHGYLPETQFALVDKITDLTHSLSALRALAASPNSSVAGIELPPEILDYVDGGRNPDVYTREFVELVQRGNAVLNGKQEAFKNFSEIFAQELASAMPETKREVERVMQNAGLQIRGSETQSQHQGDGEEEGVRRGNGEEG